MSVVMEGSAGAGEIAPHDQNQPPPEMAAEKVLEEKMKKRLFDCAMKRRWEEVVSIYKGYPEVHSAKITRSGETALHIAVSYGEERIVEQLVEVIVRGGELKMVLENISTDANEVLEKTPPPPEESPVKKTLKTIFDKANLDWEKISQLEENAKEAVQIISELETISRRTLSDQPKNEAKKALEIISFKVKQAKEIIYRVEAKKVLKVITDEAKKVSEELYEEDERDKKNSLLKNDIISVDKAKKAFQDISNKATTALSEITDHEAKSKAKQKITDLANKGASETICRDKWKERLQKISDYLEEVYAKEAKKSLEIKNERGNTALHIAAERGSVRMCHCIGQIYWEGLGVKNIDQETPFFVAALNGKKDAFLCLRHLSPKYKGFPRIRGKDGETILHCAINGDYLDLVFQIISLYPDLTECKTENGLSPLHILASKPTFFRSGSHLGRFSKIIYFCTLVDDLKVETSFDPSKWKIDEKNDSKYPENYQVCVDFFQLFSNHIPDSLAGKKNEENKGRKVDEAGRDGGDKKTEGQTTQPNKPADPENPAEQRHEMLPANCHTCFETIKLFSKAMLIILGFGSRQMRKVREKKQKHKWSVQVMDKLLDRSTLYQYEDDGQRPQSGASTSFSDIQPEESDHEHKDDEKQVSVSTTSKDGTVDEVVQKMVQLLPAELRGTISDGKNNIVLFLWEKKAGSDSGKEIPNRETPILIAAKNGITEMVERILEEFPVAIHDTNSDDKNILLLAVENRQPHVYQLLLEKKSVKDAIFHKVDRDGNSALHLAARLGDHRPWHIPGAALQMQWELKWYEFVKESVPLHYFPRHNKKGQTPKEIFTETHNDLVKSGGEWLTSTSESCSLVAALIATVAFATASTVPGGVKEDIGTPTLENKPPFDVFAISSLVALCFSVTSLVMFLAVLTSRHQEKDFGRSLPRRVLVGLTSLFVSIGAMLISFCAGHFFVLKDTLKYAALPVYAVTCLPVTFFAIAQFPLYIDLLWATFRNIPQRSYKSITP